MKADQACIVIFREKTAFRRYMICLFHVLDRLGFLSICAAETKYVLNVIILVLTALDKDSIGKFELEANIFYYLLIMYFISFILALFEILKWGGGGGGNHNCHKLHTSHCELISNGTRTN